MRAEYRKKFLKELASLPAWVRGEVEVFAFEEILQLNSVTQSGKIEKLKGYTNYYRVRFGSYRVGLHLEGEMVVFERVLHRKEIYRFFP